MKKIDLQLMLRGLAAFWVMYWHFEAAYVTNFLKYLLIPGRTAVWIFFGLSGYVIFCGFESAKYKLRLPELKMFYRNRFLRIYPLFILCSVVILIIKYLRDQGLPALDLQFFVTQIFAFQYVHNYELSGVFWTLGVEMWFYLLAPLFFLMLKPVRNFKVALVIYVFLFALTLVETAHRGTPDVRTLTSNLCHFFAGFMAVRFGPALYPKFAKFLSHFQILALSFLLFLFSAFCMGVGVRYFHNVHWFFTFGAIAVDVGIFLLLMLQPQFELKNSSSIIIRGLLKLGVISYGVYVWHSVVLLAFNVNASDIGYLYTHTLMVVSLLVAWVVYEVYEKRFLAKKKYA